MFYVNKLEWINTLCSAKGLWESVHNTLCSVNCFAKWMDELITAAEAGRLIGVSRTTMAKYCTRGLVPGAKKVATVWLVPVASLELIERPNNGRPHKDTKKPAS